MTTLDRLNRRRHQLSAGWLVLLFLVLSGAFAVLHSISLKHPISDREDALRLELIAVCNHQYPYDVRTFLNNPPTPLPGSLLLAAPFYLLGHVAWQNVLWCGAFFFFALRYFRFRATALFFLAVSLLFSPGNLNEFTSGGDFLTNFFYVSIAVAIFIRLLDRSFYAWVPASLFLGVTLSSRILFPPILVPLLALALQRTSRPRVAASFAIILVACAVVSLPIFAPHPIARFMQVELGQNATKLRFIPSALHPQWTIPLAAAIVACAAFLIRMDLPRLFLVYSAVNFVMLAPFVVSSILHSDWRQIEYLGICAMSYSLWALFQYESLTLYSTTTPQPPPSSPKILAALN
jgi:hypothetical protein